MIGSKNLLNFGSFTTQIIKKVQSNFLLLLLVRLLTTPLWKIYKCVEIRNVLEDVEKVVGRQAGRHTIIIVRR